MQQTLEGCAASLTVVCNGWCRRRPRRRVPQQHGVPASGEPAMHTRNTCPSRELPTHGACRCNHRQPPKRRRCRYVMRRSGITSWDCIIFSIS